jgi:hypothetical protein
MISFPERKCTDQDKLPHAVRKQARAEKRDGGGGTLSEAKHMYKNQDNSHSV